MLKSKSRYLWLSKKLWEQNDSYNEIKQDEVNLVTGYFKWKAWELLETEVNVNEYWRNSILVYDTKMYNLLACYNRINQTPNPIKIQWYTFIHAIVNVDWINGTKPFIPWFFIDKKVLEWIEQSDIKIIEKSLWFLWLVGNHDATMHTLWLAVLSRYPEINEFLENYIVYDFNWAATTEILSAQLHKCVVEKILTNNFWFKKMIEKSIENYCESIKDFDEKKRKYFNSVLKYVISGYIDFDWVIVTNLKNKYPMLEFEHNKWSKVIQNKKVTINNWEEVDAKEMREALRKDFLSIDKLPEEVSKLIIPENEHESFLLKIRFEKKV